MSDPRPTPIFLLHGEARGLDARGDEELMLLAAADSRPAFELLVRRHLPRLTRYCARFVGHAPGGEELAQEILVQVWLDRKRYRSRNRFLVFLFTLARNRCLNRARDEGRRRRHLDPAAELDASSSPVLPDQLEALLEEERRRLVQAALLELPAKLRETVLLRFDQGLEYAEIARIVGRSEATVRSRVFLAMKKLRDLAGGGDT